MSYIQYKYLDFYKKYGYIPKIFNAYNCTEIKDIAPTLNAACGDPTKTSGVLIIVEVSNE